MSKGQKALIILLTPFILGFLLGLLVGGGCSKVEREPEEKKVPMEQTAPQEILQGEAGEPETVQAGIISTHEINKNNPNYIFHASILGDSDLLKCKTDLSKHLDKLFLKIFDDKTPFLQTEDTKRCKNCEFLHLCGRQTVTGSY